MTVLTKRMVLLQLTTGVLAALRRSEDPLSSCTQTDPASLDACVASAIDQFTSTYLDGYPTSSFDYSSVASGINSLGSGLTSYGVTISSLVPNPATFTGSNNTGSEPHVSDIVSSYSAFSATHNFSSTGSIFSFDTSSFLATVTKSAETSTPTPSEIIQSTVIPPSSSVIIQTGGQALSSVTVVSSARATSSPNTVSSSTLATMSSDGTTTPQPGFAMVATVMTGIGVIMCLVHLL